MSRQAVEEASSSGPEQDGLPTPRRYWSAAAIWMAIFMAVLDSAIVNVALPNLAAQIGASPASSVWIINAYQLAITVLLLPLAALGDRIGYRQVYLPGLALFTIGSGLCTLASGLVTLVMARVVQGVGAAAIMSMNAALVRATYPQAMLGRGIGYNALILSMSAAIGPTAASLILSVAPWQWLFAINLPIGMAALALGWRVLPHVRGRGGKGDWMAALLSAATLGLLVYGGEALSREEVRTGLPSVLLGLVAGVLLVRREWSRPAPLVPIDLLRRPMFGLSILTSIVSFAAQMLAFVTMPFVLQAVLHRGVVESGLLITPWPLAVAVAAPLAGRLADRHSAGLLGGFGLIVFASGLFLLASLGEAPGTFDIAWRMAVCGFGFGFFQSPNNRAIVNAAPRDRTGAAGGMLATARLLGQTTGAVSVAAAFHLVGVSAGPGLLHWAAGAALAAAGISLLRLKTEQPRPRGASNEPAFE